MKLRVSLVVTIGFLGVTSQAQTLFVKINPILVADSGGANLSPDLSYREYANKIYQQADIVLDFLPTVFVNNTTLNTWNINNSSLFNQAGNGKSTDPLVINAWFVKSISGASVYGFAASINSNLIVMDTSNIAGFSSLGRVDTFSHELGHALGLSHTSTPNHLMASGGVRQIPQSLSNVAPDGLNLDFLTQSQINTIRNSQYAQAVPEPVSMVALSLGVVALAKRRKKAA